MKEIFLIQHCKGAFGLRFFGFGPNLLPNKGLLKLKQFLDRNTFWAKGRTTIVSIWYKNKIVGFGRGLSDGIYRGVLWDIVIDKDHQGKGYGKLIVQKLLNSKQIQKTQKIYLMTTNKKQFYSQVDFKEVTSQKLLIREI